MRGIASVSLLLIALAGCGSTSGAAGTAARPLPKPSAAPQASRPAPAAAPAPKVHPLVPAAHHPPPLPRTNTTTTATTSAASPATPAPATVGKTRVCYPAVTLPAVSLPAVTLPATSLPAVTVNGVHYPAQHYPAQHYPAQHYPAQHFGGQCLQAPPAFAPAKTTVLSDSAYPSVDPAYSPDLTQSYRSSAGDAASIPDPAAPGFGAVNAAGFPKNEYVRSYRRSDGTMVSGYWRNSSSDGLPTCVVAPTSR